MAGRGGGVRTWSGKGQKANWKPGLVEHCPSQTEEQEASPMGLLRTKSLSGMNVLLCKVLVCPEADCEVEGPQKSQPLRHGIIEAQSQGQVGFQELQGLQVLASKGVSSLVLEA